MDQQKLFEVADYVTKLKLFPYFDIAHYAVMCLIVRDDGHVPEHSGINRYIICK
jgi:trimeric intracellular cation channel